MADLTKSLARRAGAYDEHLRQYLETDGEDGYLYDMSRAKPLPCSPGTPTLILRTYGRKSGQIRMTPLVYCPWGHEFILVGSKGGHDAHPAWYLNLVAHAQAEWQVRATRFRGSWSEPVGAQREKIWNYAAAFFPNYRAYQDRTSRLLPLIVLSPAEAIAERFDMADIGTVPSPRRSDD